MHPLVGEFKSSADISHAPTLRMQFLRGDPQAGRRRLGCPICLVSQMPDLSHHLLDLRRKLRTNGHLDGAGWNTLNKGDGFRAHLRCLGQLLDLSQPRASRTPFVPR